MNYVVTYFTPLLSFDLNDMKSVMMNVLLFLLIGLMYVGSSATYLNPVLGVFGFKIFGVSGFPHAHHIISSFSFSLYTGYDILGLFLNGFTFKNFILCILFSL